MKKILYITYLSLISTHTMWAVNPMIAAMEAASKRSPSHTTSDTASKKTSTSKTVKPKKTTTPTPAPTTKKTASTKKTTTSKKTDKKVSTSTIKKSKANVPQYIVSIKNKSSNKSAHVSSIGILYTPANSTKTLSALTSKKFTIPKNSTTTISLGLKLENGESYAGVSELIVGAKNNKIMINSNLWSTTSNQSNQQGGGWINVAGYPDAIYLNYVDDKWVLDIDAMRKSIPGYKAPKTTSTETATTPSPTQQKESTKTSKANTKEKSKNSSTQQNKKSVASKKATKHTIVAAHKDSVKTKLTRKTNNKK